MDDWMDEWVDGWLVGWLGGWMTVLNSSALDCAEAALINYSEQSSIHPEEECWGFCAITNIVQSTTSPSV